MCYYENLSGKKGCNTLDQKVLQYPHAILNKGV